MKKWMWGLFVLSGAGCVLCAAAGMTALAITTGTFFYHIAMRLAVGHILQRMNLRFDAESAWFAEKKWERRLYAVLRVRTWKDKMPSYNPGDFDVKKHSDDEIVQTMCLSEVVHEVIVVLSFVPLMFAIPFGELWVFVLTSAASAGLDGAFVLMQRFNRPRVMKLMQRKQKKE